MTQRNPIAPPRATGTAHPAQLLQRCQDDYQGNAARRDQDHRDDAHLVTYTPSAVTPVREPREPSDLAVAAELAERTLAAGNDLAIREALRILLRAVRTAAVTAR
ncbi:hypothetical protein [Streptomyces siamensis]|uniref:Uncharacterized protein n=1 Tax=Streptomyces siamensis TaxID=1274986 RepID=A0ABP9JKQ5_9ACTN